MNLQKMKLLKNFAILLSTLTLIACGGGGSPDGSPTPPDRNPTPPDRILLTPVKISIADATSVGETYIAFKVTTNKPTTKQVTFDYKLVFVNLTTNKLATTSDFIGTTSGKITIAANSSEATIEIELVDDNLREPDETFLVILSNLVPADATFTKGAATGIILASDSVKLRINDVDGSEGENITFTVASDQTIAEQINFRYALDFNGAATTSDLSGQLTGTGTIAANDSSTTISIGIVDDNLREPDETFLVILSDLVPADVTFTKGAATGTILASDPVKLRINDVDGSEGENITFTVASDQTIAEQINFRYALDFNGAATTSDLSGQLTGTGTIAANDSSTTISIGIVDDNLREPDETFLVILSDLVPADVTFTKGAATGTILASDPVKLRINDVDGSEGENITFTVASDQTIAEQINFRYALDFNGAATTSDLSGQLTGTSTIAANDSSTTISIGIVDDNLREPDETFLVILSDLVPADVTFTKGAATGTILASDPVKLRINDVDGSEGENITFTVASDQTIAEPISFDYRVALNNPLTSTSANANDLSGKLTGTGTIAANDSSTTISIGIVDDNLREPDETFSIVFSNLVPTDATFTKGAATGTILASDPVKLRINDVDGSEGENITFTVASDQTIAEPISFDYRVALNNPLTSTSANANDLSGKLTGTGTIAANDSSTTISIGIVDDNLREPDETFSVILSDPVPADTIFIDYIAIGKIASSDVNGIITISVADAEASEDTRTINFQVSSNFETTADVTFYYEATVDNTSNSASNNDFTTKKGRATITAGEDSTTISISLIPDEKEEPDETFRLLLTNTSSNATLDLANNSAVGTIINDDILGEISGATAIIGNKEIILNWTNPDSNIFAGVTISQTIGATTTAESCSSGVTSDAEKATSDTITDLTNGTAYSFRICARSTTNDLSIGDALTNIIPSIIDQDEDGLIDIATTEEFNNIRYSLAGTGYKTSSKAYPVVGGCPDNVCIGYELTANINLSNYPNWEPIGSNSDRFTAILEGNNKTINNLTIDRANNNYVGLFSAIQDATISNLKLTNISVAGNKYVGALVGDATNSTLSSIGLIGDNSQRSSNAEIKGTKSRVGSLVGSFSGTISDASSNLTVIGAGNSNSIGGLVGEQNGGSIIKSWASGNVSSNVSSNWGYGGLVGSKNSGSISQSWASGNVSSNGNNNAQYGGLVGLQNGGSISQSWASGNVSSDSNEKANWYYGGLVGLQNNNGSISQSWASGNVSSNGRSWGYGGLVGLNTNSSSISQSWASGNVAAGAHIGGLVGWNSDTSGSISQSWASGNVVARTLNMGGLVGLNDNDNDNGNINGRNYQLDPNEGFGVNNSIRLADATALANLSGANTNSDTTSDRLMNSGWHAGFDITDPTDDIIDLETRFCDTNGDETIDVDERVATNSVWVMPSDSTSSTFPTGMSDNIRPPAGFYAIPAIRCIGTTPDERKANSDRQRRQFMIP